MQLLKIIEAMKKGRPVYYLDKSTKVILRDNKLQIRHISGVTSDLLNSSGGLNFGRWADYKVLK